MNTSDLNPFDHADPKKLSMPVLTMAPVQPIRVTRVWLPEDFIAEVFYKTTEDAFDPGEIFEANGMEFACDDYGLLVKTIYGEDSEVIKLMNHTKALYEAQGDVFTDKPLFTVLSNMAIETNGYLNRINYVGFLKTR